MSTLRTTCGLGVALLAVGACTYDWEQFDPRISAGGGTAAGVPAGGAGGAGGAGATGGGGTAGSGGSGGTGGGASGGSGGAEPLGPWGAPELVTELSSLAEDDDDPCFTGDLLELYFNSSRDPPSIWKSTRAQVSDPWGAPVAVPELNDVHNEGNMAIAPDGLTLWLSSNRDTAGGHHEIYVSTRPDRGTAWSTPAIVPELNTADSDFASSVSADGLTLIGFSDDSGGLGGDDLFVATRATTSAAWSAPAAITALNTAAHDANGWLGPDSLTLYFSSTRTADSDIYVSTRATPTDGWGVPAPVTELNSGASESDPWLSPDQRLIMFTSGATGDREIYQAVR